MDMNTIRDLINAFLARPDGEVRLVLADALDDFGQERGAELLRLPGRIEIRDFSRDLLEPYPLEAWYVPDEHTEADEKVYLRESPQGFEYPAIWVPGSGWVE